LSGAADEQSGRRIALTEEVACVGGEAAVSVDPAGWPSDIDGIDSGRAA
jgi:hypothetical protein